MAQSNGESRILMGVNIDTINKPDLNEPEVANAKKIFDQWLMDNQVGKSTSYIQTEADVDLIKEVLRGK